MSGGGTKVAKGRMGCKAVTEEKVDPRMLENLEKSVEEDIETLQVFTAIVEICVCKFC